MRFGFKTAMLAAGLVLAGASHAAPQAATVAAPPPQPVVAQPVPAPAVGAVPSAQTPTTPRPATAQPVAAATPAANDPLLVRDGAPEMAPTPGIGQAVDGAIGMQPQVTKNGERAVNFHNHVLMWVITIISVFVLILLIVVMLRFNRRANPVPSKTAHNTLLEVAWTLIPVLILFAIAVPSIGLLQAQYKAPPSNAITLKATGNQWYWTYSYPDNGGFEITSNILKEKDEVGAGERARVDADGPRLLAVDNRVVLPVGVPIKLITTSADVIHSWAMPAFYIKLDAVPGRINETSFTIEKPGLYFGQCSELCGPKHGYMPIAVEAVPLDVYNRWVVAKGGTVAGAKPAALTPDTAAVDATTGPTVNATVTPPTSSQAPTSNPAGAGNPGN